MEKNKEVRELQARIGAELRTQLPEKFNFTRHETASFVACVKGHRSNCEVDGKPLIEPGLSGCTANKNQVRTVQQAERMANEEGVA